MTPLAPPTPIRRHGLHAALRCRWRSRRLVASLFVAISVAIPARPAAAQIFGRPVAGYSHSVWTTRHGLPQNIVRGLVQTQDGYLWLATGSGVVRFDGVAFTTFDAENTPGLASNWIATLHEARDGTLWIGTDTGLVCYRHGRFTSVRLPDLETDRAVRGIQSDSRGHIWALRGPQLLRYDGTRWDLFPLGNIRTTVLLVDRHDTAWIGAEQGLLEWRGGVRRRFTVRDGLPNDFVGALYEDRAGQLWIGGWAGVVRLDRATGVIAREGAPLSTNVNRFFEDRDGVLWIGGSSTLFARTRDGRVVEHRVEEAANGAQVVALAQTKDGHLWFGAEGGPAGLHRLSRLQVETIAHERGLSCDNVVPVTQTTDGTVWIGAHCGGGASLTAIRGGQVRPILSPGAHASGPTPVHQVTALLAEPDGGLWIGTLHGDLVHLRDKRLTRYAYGPDSPFTGRGGIVALARDARGALWAGTTGGLHRYEAGRWSTFRTTDGLVDDDVRSIVGDGQGGLWIGTAEGLSQYVDGRFTNYTQAAGLPPGAVRAIHVDGDGVVWAGTYGGGLCRLEGGRATRFGRQHGLLDTTVHRILEDDRGNLWLSGDRGVRRVSRRELNDVARGRATRIGVVAFDEQDGMKNAECNGMGQPAGWKARDGSVWFPTQGGVVRIDPASAALDVAMPPVAIEEVVVDGRRHDLQEPITVPPGSRELEVRYSAPSFTRPEQTQFRYRLAGDDTGWIEAGTRRIAMYTKVAPGRYTFEVMARGAGGPWSTTTSRIALIVEPRWYERTVAHVAFALAFIAVGLILIRMRDARLRRRARQLETLVAERTVELSDEREGLNRANRDLEAARSALQSSHTQLLSVLDQLRVGVVIVDPRHEILFVSEATRRLLGGLGDEVIGQTLDRALPIGPDSMSHVETLLRDPHPGTRLTVQFKLPSGRAAFTELEARPDPRDPRNRLLYLYDVTEVFTLKGMRHLDAAKAAGRQGAPSPLIGRSVAMRFVHGQIQELGAVDATVLIEGETGTGKELVARAIHEASRRKDRPFVAINCAGLTESLLASQLFGHRRGAFTDAVTDHVGLFEAAQGGTLLLDEIGDMPMSVQTHLLRVLQEREILRVGDSKPRPIDVRVLVSTHRSLEEEVALGQFREDLLYRILVTRIALPALRHRIEDIPLLATAFLEQFCAAHGKHLDGFSREAMERLVAQRWPGNVRELRAAIESAVIRAAGPTIRQTDLPSPGVKTEGPFVRSGEDEERQRLLETLARAGGNRSVAAKMLGMSRSTLYRRLAALGIDSTPDN